MKIYGTNLKLTGRVAAMLLALAPGWTFGQAQTPPTRIARSANQRPASMSAPRAVNRSTSAAAQRYVFGRVDLATGDGPEGVAVGVFKNGGLPGVAVANIFSNTVTILLANADGTYQPGVDYATGFEPVAVAVADFNGDHNLDLAVVNWDGTVSILLGNGDGSFQPQVTYAGSSGVLPAILAADFNGDKIPDLAVSSNTGGSVSILLGHSRTGIGHVGDFPGHRRRGLRNPPLHRHRTLAKRPPGSQPARPDGVRWLARHRRPG